MTYFLCREFVFRSVVVIDHPSNDMPWLTHTIYVEFNNLGFIQGSSNSYKITLYILPPRVFI